MNLFNVFCSDMLNPRQYDVINIDVTDIIHVVKNLTIVASSKNIINEIGIIGAIIVTNKHGTIT